MRKVALLIIALLTMIPAGQAYAEEFTVCAQYLPCGPDGELLVNDPKDPCFEEYSRACDNVSTNKLTEKFQYCESSRQNLIEENDALRKKLAALTRKSRASKRRK